MPCVANLTNGGQQVPHLGRVEPRHDFIEQQQARRRRQRARKLKALPGPDGQGSRRLIEKTAQPEPLGDLLGGIERGHAIAMSKIRADRNVLAHGETDERLDDLKRAREALARQLMWRHASDIPTGEIDVTLSGLLEARDDGKQRRFSGAVWSDESSNASCLDIERRGVDSAQAAKLLRNLLDLEERLIHGLPSPQQHWSCWIGRRQQVS